MKKLLSIAVMTLLVIACNIKSGLNGRTLYLLNFGYTSVQEVQLNFISTELVELRTSLMASTYNCEHYNNSPSLLDKSVILKYNFNNGILEIPEKKLRCKLTVQEHDNFSTNTGEFFYSTSIVEHLNDDEGKQRIFSNVSNRRMADMFISMIGNNNEPAIIKENGRIKINPNKPQQVQ